METYQTVLIDFPHKDINYGYLSMEYRDEDTLYLIDILNDILGTIVLEDLTEPHSWGGMTCHFYYLGFESDRKAQLRVGWIYEDSLSMDIVNSFTQPFDTNFVFKRNTANRFYSLMYSKNDNNDSVIIYKTNSSGYTSAPEALTNVTGYKNSIMLSKLYCDSDPAPSLYLHTTNSSFRWAHGFIENENIREFNVNGRSINWYVDTLDSDNKYLLPLRFYNKKLTHLKILVDWIGTYYVGTVLNIDGTLYKVMLVYSKDYITILMET